MFSKASLHCIAVASRIVTLSTSCLSPARSHAFCSEGCLGSNKWYSSHLLPLNLQAVAAIVLYNFRALLHSHLLWIKWIFSLPSEFMCKFDVVVLPVRPVAEICQSKGRSICCFLFAYMPCKAGSGFSLNSKFTVTPFWNGFDFISEWIKAKFGL